MTTSQHPPFRRPLVEPREAARILGVSEKQLLLLTQAHEIRYVNVGLGEKRERRRYDPLDIEDFIERRKTFGTAKVASVRVNSRTRYFQIHDIKEIRESLRKKKTEGRK